MKKLLTLIIILLIQVPVFGATLDDVLNFHNSKGEPVRIMFEDLGKLNKALKGCFGVSVLVKGTHYILLDKSIKNEPTEAIMAVVAHEAIHTEDMADSIEEEIAAFTQETIYWQECTKKNPELLFKQSPLLDNLNYLLFLYLKGGSTDQYIRPFVKELYKGYPATSPGYGNVEKL